MHAGPLEPEIEAATFIAKVEPLRQEVIAVLGSESAQSDLAYTDDGINAAVGRWTAKVWRSGDGGSAITITCAQGPGERWQVAMMPSDPDRTMYILNWPSMNFQSTLRAAVGDLGA